MSAHEMQEQQDAQDIVLAFSGGLDTSFCVPWLTEKGYRVTTVFVDTGGISDAQRHDIASRAIALGAHAHISHDAAQDLWDSFVIPLVMSGAAYQDQYPLLCSDRYLIAHHMAKKADELGTRFVAHGCTAAGNDQFRFDQSLRCLGSYDILAPVRELQSVTDALRSYEIEYLRNRGVEVDDTSARYTINENCLGATISGSEIDSFGAPGPDAYVLTAPPSQWPDRPLQMSVHFEQGRPVALNGCPMPGPDMLRELNAAFGTYGVGRGIYTGDTTIGLKGRIVFECPALEVLRVAHRALEELTLTRHQISFKPQAAQRWVELVYQGFFFEPLRIDLESFLTSTQEHVTGTVTLETHGGNVGAIAIDTDHQLVRDDAMYAQGAPWSDEEARGFIHLFGQCSMLARLRDQRINTAAAST